jgi:hypothetical protein
MAEFLTFVAVLAFFMLLLYGSEWWYSRARRR